VNGCNQIHDRQEVINQIIRQRWPGDFAPKETFPSSSSNSLSDEKILEIAFKDPKFRRLWNGDISGYPSQSEADSALVMKLLFFTGKDSQRTDALFRQSGLMREKWERQDYRQRTIEHALRLVKETYRPMSEIRKPQSVTTNDFPQQAIGGLAGKFANLYSIYLESPWSFFAFNFLTCLGNVMADRITIQSELQPEPRLYVVNCGESADDRKSESIKKTVRFFENTLEAGSFKVCYGVGSAEGLANRLKENPRTLLVFDELKSFVSKSAIDGAILLPCVNSLFEDTRFHCD
jgi:hypothetical protein